MNNDFELERGIPDDEWDESRIPSDSGFLM